MKQVKPNHNQILLNTKKTAVIVFIPVSENEKFEKMLNN